MPSQPFHRPLLTSRHPGVCLDHYPRLVCWGGLQNFFIRPIFQDMGEQNKTLPRPIFHRDKSWDRFPNWPQSRSTFSQDYSLPRFLETSDQDLIDWAKRRLGSFSWSGYAQPPPLPPFSSKHPVELNQNDLRKRTGGVSEIGTGQGSWKINLDVNHFSPEEIIIKAKEGYLLISGNHEDRQEEHGLLSRSFTRKYRLPEGVDMEHISSSLSGDGVLSVEAPVPGSSICTPINEGHSSPVQTNTGK